jgi:serine protease
MRYRLLLLAALASALIAVPPVAAAAPYVPNQVIVHYKDGTSGIRQDRVQDRTGTGAGAALPGGSQRLEIEDGDSVGQTVTQLKKNEDVAYAVPNFIAHAAALHPNDPAFGRQWNFLGPPGFGIDMPDAWTLARQAHAPGARGATVAVLDTGAAYRPWKRKYRRAPDINGWVKGYDFVDRDRHPFDQNGHGTHVSGTIAESTNNKLAAAGIAYRARIMPLRVLDRDGAGDTVAIARAIRYAARRRVDVINMSLEFDSSVRASQIPDIISALRYARRKRVTVVAAAGNQADAVVAYPARARDVIAVAATTERGCEADYSNAGTAVDLAAPGGGIDAPNVDNPWDAAHCRPDAPGQDIFQQTFTSSPRRFSLPSGYEGTSMAAPHVSGIAAVLIASRRLGRHPSPFAVERQLERTACDAGPPGFDPRYGHGMVSAPNALGGLRKCPT